MEELKNRIAVFTGACLLALVGRDRFYQLAQDRTGVAGRIASAFCQGHAGRVGANYAIYSAEKDKERITDIALAYYGDDSLHGFGDVDYTVRSDGKALLEQQRGLIVPAIEEAIASDRPATVVEIGVANGDVLVHLAKRHPEISFIGVDLSIANAQAKHANGPANLHLVKGYALDLLRDGSLRGDLIFGSSTFVVMAPREFDAFLVAASGAKRLVISDPVTFGNRHNEHDRPVSRHMDLYMWWHNYRGYLLGRGWRIDRLETVNYAYTHNPNAKVVLISASKKA